ncbi:MAG: thermonuclease family protein [Planctomycetota bacterium]
MLNKIIRTVFLLSLATTAVAQDAVVRQVIDGDTFLLADGRKVRLIGVDCPEMRYPSGAGMLGTLRLKGFMSPEEREALEPRLQKVADRLNGVGELITKLVKRPIEGMAVELEFDNMSGREDRYGRLLAYVWIRKQGKREMINAVLLKRGMARLYDRFKFSKQDEFRKLEAEARKKQLGIWKFPAVKERAAGKQQ